MRSQFVVFLLALGLALVAPASASPRTTDPTEAVAGAVRLGTPRPVAVSWTELVVDVPVVVRPVGVSGRIESVTFTDLRLNGIPFEIDPYTASFELPNDEAVALPRPLRMRVKFSSVAPGVLEEALVPSDALRLTGTATVDGTFRKWFLSVKRRLDVPIDESGPNPIAEYHPLKMMLAELDRLERSGWWPPF